MNTISDVVELVRGGGVLTTYGYVNAITQGDLVLLSYTDAAHHAAEWSYLERVSRGLIINKVTGEIVARPFDKFFHWLEGGRRASGHIVTVMEKLDGSLGILYRANGYKITTKGDFNSAQASWATEYLNTKYNLKRLPDELTLLFEIIYPGNRVILDYGAREDLVLLAARNRFTGAYLPFYPDLYELAKWYGFNLPQTYPFNNLREILAETGTTKHEGWVVEFSDHQRFKFKGDYYLEQALLLAG